MSNGEDTIATSDYRFLPLDILEEQLKWAGYTGSNGAIVRQYDYLTETAGRQCADLIAFADPLRCDISTACVAVELMSDEQDRLPRLQNLSYVGVPIVLIALPSKVEIWPVVSPGVGVQTRPLERLPYARLPEYFRQHRTELTPRSLLNAKQGVRQLSFIDVDSTLEVFARTTTKRTLLRQFTEAIGSFNRETRKRYSQAVTRSAIWVLAACILQDKLSYQNNIYSDFRAVDSVVPLLETAQGFFPNYFTSVWEYIDEIGIEAVEDFYEALGREFTFRSLTNDMLAYLYENTLVDKEMRDNLGVYYTPQRPIAERILQRLPVEDVPREERTVLDGTCGSGNLLLAAYDRLLHLLPPRWTSRDRHEYLLRHIWGIDIDPFACEIARLSLLLYSLPEGDSWRVKEGNVFEVDLQQLFGGRPSVIIGNPPFKEPRSTEGKRIQRAALVLDRYLEWLKPNGLLGVVVPKTFLQNASGKSTRSHLLKRFDVMEVWHLPEGTIPSSSVGTAVILARKLQKARSSVPTGLTRVERVGRIERQPNSLQQEDPVSTHVAPYLVSQKRWFDDTEVRMGSSIFDPIWDRIAEAFPTVDPRFGKLFNGVQVGKQARLTHLSERPLGDGWKAVLNKNTHGTVLSPFQLYPARQTEKYIRYPSEELQWPRSQSHFDYHSKVVMNATRNPKSPWRLIAAVDRQRLVVSENFHYGLPQGASAEELATILNSTVANAWFSSRNYQRKINLSVLKELPFPYFSEHQRNEINSLVRQAESLHDTSHRQSSIKLRRELIVRLDDIVFDAYGIDNEEKQQICSWMSRFRRPGFSQGKETSLNEVRSIPYRGRRWEVTCEVESISADHKAVALWVLGSSDSDSSVEVPIPDLMPGWALRPGTGFVATVPWDQRYLTDIAQYEWLDFRPLEYGHLSEEELVSSLSEQR